MLEGLGLFVQDRVAELVEPVQNIFGGQAAGLKNDHLLAFEVPNFFLQCWHIKVVLHYVSD